MKFWLVNHSWESFKATKEYCGFQVESERNKISVGDRIVYFGQGLVFGVFEVSALPNNEFNGWKKAYSFQVKLNQIALALGGLIAKPLESKILIQKSSGGSPNLLELSKQEYDNIKETIEQKQKALVF
ncbi:MAG TPA: hypothetical protein VJG83_00385 [archaeon]|nr:hypothetical protein [archaeon]